MTELHTRRRSITRWQLALLAGLMVVAVGSAAVLLRSSASSPSQSALLARNGALDGGTSISGRQAPDLTLTDQFGRRVSLASFRGRVVLLAFNDSQCTTICPLTTTEMVDAKKMLGAAGSNVALLGIDANPHATAVKNVRAYSEVHGMMHEWDFLTGSLAQLRRVWRSYYIDVQIEEGAIDHTPALYIISRTGALAKVYLIEMAYVGIDQQAQILARAAAGLLPDHPAVHSNLSYARIPAVAPTSSVSLPRAGGGAVPLGPGALPRLYLFFDTWDSEVMRLGRELERLSRYESAADANGLPALTAVDEASVEPSLNALPDFLGRLPHPLPYPVPSTRAAVRRRLPRRRPALDGARLPLRTDPLALRRLDFGLAKHRALEKQVRAALARAPKAPASLTAALKQLAGSPPPLQALHEQADQLLGHAERAQHEAPRTTRLPGRDQRLGLMVPTLPFRVSPVRIRLGALRATSRVPRR